MAEPTQQRPALYRLERTESGYRFTLYSMRGQGTESAAGAGQRGTTHAGGGEVVHERIKRNEGGEYAGKGKEDNSRMARRTPRGEFREKGSTQQRRATVRVRQR